MTIGRRYLVGMGVAAAIGAAVVALLPAGMRGAMGVAVVVGFFVQAPLGWMLVRVFGKPGFLPVWGIGILLRGLTVAVLAVAGSVTKLPELDVLLVGVVGTLFCLLLVEAGVLMTGDAE